MWITCWNEEIISFSKNITFSVLCVIYYLENEVPHLLYVLALWIYDQGLVFYKYVFFNISLR